MMSETLILLQKARINYKFIRLMLEHSVLQKTSKSLIKNIPSFGPEQVNHNEPSKWFYWNDIV